MTVSHLCFVRNGAEPRLPLAALAEKEESILLTAGNYLNVPKGSFADRVQEKVLIARKNSKWRREHMEWKMTLLNERVKGREEGRKEGLAEGRLLNQIDLIIKKIQKGKDLSEIADMLEEEEEVLRPVWEAVKAAAPEYNREEIPRRIKR